MGLLDTLGKQVGGSSLLGSLGGSQQGALLQGVSGLISNSGGLSGVLSKFHQHGLGQHAQSWVGNGENMPITGEHVEKVFGADQVQQVAQKAGTDTGHASNLIASVLPHLVNKLTPHGQPVSDADAHQGMSGILSGGLGSLLGGK